MAVCGKVCTVSGLNISLRQVSIPDSACNCLAVYSQADKTVKVWDVSTQSCQHTLKHHANKVQAVAWNPAEAPVLLTGAFDKTACLVSRC